ncbi:MAG TPA: CAP domain-containing protein [Longimicrobiales bacterium]|nr:CAP domain-containing protein [Longimicrobiales bacterium]
MAGRAVVAGALGLWCAACAGGQAASGGGVPGDASGTYAHVADGMTTELNRLRAARRLQTLRTDPALVRAATDYAAELATRRTLDHHSPVPGRHTHTQRIDHAGGRWQRAAENLASTYGEAAEVPAKIIEMWLGSDMHRRNLLEAEYTHTGAGIARDTRGQWYIVQLYTLQPASCRGLVRC